MIRRASGILLHITSLPSPFGIGDLGPPAYRFVDFLSETRQGFWQVLPINPTSLARGSSPYSSLSAFAGNALLISPELLVKEGLLSKSDLKDRPAFPQKVDYPAVAAYKEKLFRIAYARFNKKEESACDLECFVVDHNSWLEDYVLFIALKEHFGAGDWGQWPEGARHRETIEPLKKELSERCRMERFLQYLFFKQWFSLKGYCRRKGIQIIGDLPIYVDYDSPDVWSHPEIFKLGPDKRPIAVSGIPPDYFSATGQRWGNPIYRWDVLKEKDYAWWVERITHNLKLFDWLRLDHFKGFVDYWEVPAGEKRAVNGTWVKGPREDFFNCLLKYFPLLPFIAEDLGVITGEVQRLRDGFGLPGMRVLQFAFGNDPLSEQYKPYSYIENCVAYSGTHDNDTLLGWLCGGNNYSTRNVAEIEMERKNALAYLGLNGKRRKEIPWEFIRALMASTANLTIFPLQDILGLGGEARMNFPGRGKGNWQWRFLPGQLTPSLSKRLTEMTEIYGRA
jgi:4-alpha-glucanotransferase